MYRTCKCEDFPCCGHGLVDTMDYDPLAGWNPWDDETEDYWEDE